MNIQGNSKPLASYNTYPVWLQLVLYNYVNILARLFLSHSCVLMACYLDFIAFQT